MTPTGRRRRAWLAAAAVTLTALALVGAQLRAGPGGGPEVTLEATGGLSADASRGFVGAAIPEDPRETSDEPDREPLPVAPPVRIEIPAIDVDHDIVPVGLRPDGAMQVPDFGLAGWYTEGPRPGAQGPSTVVAHVDSRDGPDVFYRLRDLRPGDLVHIHRADGTAVSFTMEEAERTGKDALPGDRIWGWTEQPTLRLITCDGLFDRASGHYEDNLIVYLTLAEG